MSGIALNMRRPHDGRVVLGVCAAIARRYGLDPTLVRIVTAIGLIVLTTPVLVAYAGLALVIPRDDGRMLIGGEPRDRRETVLGWTTVALAAGLAIASPTILGWGGGIDGFEIGLLVVAVAILAWSFSRDEEEGSSPSVTTAAGAGESGPGPARPAAGSAPTTATTAVQATAEPPTAQLPPDPATYVAPPKEPRSPSIFVPVAAAIVGLIGLTAVVVSVFDVSVTPVTVAVVAGFAAVASAGVAIASFGRRGAVPLLIMGALFAIVASVSAIGRDEFDRGIGYREYDPITVAEVEDGYDHGVGFMEIDLRDVDLPPGTTTMPVHVGWGAAQVRVPEGLRVVTSGDNISGDLPAASGAGTGSASGGNSGARGAGKKGGAPEEPPTLAIDAEVGVGTIELTRGNDRGWGPD